MEDLDMNFSAEISFEEYVELYAACGKIGLMSKVLKRSEENKAIVTELNDISEMIGNLMERFKLVEDEPEKKEE